MYMNVHKTGFSAVFHISVMIFKLAHLIHLDLDHQNVFRQFHILFFIKTRLIRLSGICLSVYPVSVYPVSVYPVSVYPVSVYPVSVYPVSVYPVSVYPVSVYPVSGTRLFYHATDMILCPL